MKFVFVICDESVTLESNGKSVKSYESYEIEAPDLVTAQRRFKKVWDQNHDVMPIDILVLTPFNELPVLSHEKVLRIDQGHYSTCSGFLWIPEEYRWADGEVHWPQLVLYQAEDGTTYEFDFDRDTGCELVYTCPVSKDENVSWFKKELRIGYMPFNRDLDS